MLHGLKIYLYQLSALTIASLKSRYRLTIIGFIWVALNPILTFGTQAFVFGTILKIQVDNYLLFLLSGLLPWIFFAQSLEMSTNSFVQNGPMIKSFAIDPTIYLFSLILENFITFLSILILTIIVVLISGFFTWWQIFALPLPLLSLILGVTSLCLIAATIQVFFRDLKFIISFCLSLAFLLTPIFYPESYIPEEFAFVAKINPIYLMILPFKDLFNLSNSSQLWPNLIKSYSISLILFFVAAMVWKIYRRKIPVNV